jgi:hypothetical protein
MNEADSIGLQKPSAAAKPSTAEKEGSRVSSDYGSPTRKHAEGGLAERSGEAERIGEGGVGGLS